MESENLSRVENILKNGGLSTPDIVIVVIYFLGRIAIKETMTHYQYTYLEEGLTPPPRLETWNRVNGEDK